MDTGAVKGIARGAQQCTNIGLSASFLCWPAMLLGPQFQPQVSLRFRVMGSCPLQGQWEWKMHIKESPALCQHCFLHMFVISASYSTGDLSFRPPTHLWITWVFHNPKYFMYKVYQFSFLFSWEKTYQLLSSFSRHFKKNPKNFIQRVATVSFFCCTWNILHRQIWFQSHSLCLKSNRGERIRAAVKVVIH